MGLFDLFAKKKETVKDTVNLPNYTTVVFDVETTGLSPFKDEILQLSMIDEHENVLYNCYFKPQKVKSWPEAQKINKISPEMVARKQSFASSINEIQRLFDRASYIMGYNVEFDIRFLETAGIKGLKEKQIIDVMNEYRNAFHNSKLEDAAKSFGFEYNAHDALEDVKATLFVHNQLQFVPKKEISSSVPKEKKTSEKNLQQKIGDKKIAELQAEVYEEVVNRNFKPETPVFEGLHIFCSVYPEREGFYVLNDGEKTVFKAFADLCRENDIAYEKIRMIRHSGNDFVIEHPSCWVGRFRVKQKAPKYDIYPVGSDKRKRVGKTLEEAHNILAELGEGFEIRIRAEAPVCNLLVSNTNNSKSYENISVEELVEHLPEMIKYIKKCQRN